jgi:sulfatase modifying factor 1
MGETVHKVLWFDRFALDLTRGCLRSGDEVIELRPKAFEVLRHLAANAGALVAKRELYEAVWPNVAVSDDSLVQCIRELRLKLGDHEHRLIKTVSRRGYLLDATLRTGAEADWPVGSVKWLSGHWAAARKQRDKVIASILRFGQLVRERRWHALAAAGAGLILLGGAGTYLLARWAIPTRISASPSKYSASPLVAPPPPTAFKDCDVCPEMVELPGGEFAMGAPEDEVGRKQTEGPQQRITIAKPFAIARFEITVDQFSVFVAETGFATGNTCHVVVQFDSEREMWSRPQASFRQPGIDVTGSHPVVCVSWHDAQAYVAWLKRRTGKPYRLPAESEWEYAARAGTTTSYSFGMDETVLCAYARFADLGSPFGWRGGCRGDAAAFGPLQVGKLKPNPWGIFDMHGNVWEWVEDCWTPDMRKIPTDGSAFLQPGGCEIGVVRGGSFVSAPRTVRSAHRRANAVAKHYQSVGFRVALTLSAQR